MIRALGLSLLAGASALAPQTPEPQVLPQEPAPAAERLALTFAWPESGSVRVNEKRTKPDGRAEMAYTLRWFPEEETNSVILEHEDFAFVTFNGLPPDDPRLAKAMKVLLPLTSAIPAMRLTREGQYVECLDFDELLQTMFEIFDDLGVDEGELAMMRQALASPAVRSAAMTAVGNAWMAWAGAFAGREVWVGASGEAATFEVQRVLLTGGSPVPARTVLSCSERFLDDGVDCVRLSFEQVLEGPAMERAFGEMVLDMMPDAELPEGVFEGTRREVSISGVWELATLRPRQVLFVEREELVVRGQAPELEEDRREFRFDWSARATGKGAAKPAEEPGNDRR